MSACIFVVDDDSAQLSITEDILVRRLGYQVLSALGGKAAIERFLLRMAPKPDLLLLDLVMPEVSGAEVTKLIRRIDPHIPIIILSPYDNHPLLMQAMQAGANDCLQKPVNVNWLRMTIERLLQRENMRSELDRLSRYQSASYSFDDMIGQSDAIKQVINQAKKAAASHVPLCIVGENGVGKELLARIIHHAREREKSDFITISPHEITDENDIISRLKHETHNDAASHMMSGSTLFFRHIDKLGLRQQDALAESFLTMRDSQSPAWYNKRFIASSLQPLSTLYRNGKITEKLYFYLSSMTITISPLRDRPDDIIMLAKHYLQRYSSTQISMIREISEPAKDVLLAYHWPDNVTELKHIMQRIALTCAEHVLKQEHIEQILHYPGVNLSMAMPVKSSGNKGGYSLLNQTGDLKPFEQMEAEIIRFAIEFYGGKMTEVAKRLGIGRSTLYRKMQDYKLKSAA